MVHFPLNRLKTINGFPSQLPEVGVNGFMGCTSIERLPEFPGGCTIGMGAFDGCSSLAVATFRRDSIESLYI